jgi:HEAT repeat protein
VREAAASAGIAERTATRRKADPGFRQRVATLRGDMVQAAFGRVTDGMTEAADALRALLKAESESVRLGAARAICELGCKLRESIDLSERVTAIEENQSRADETPFAMNGTTQKVMT